MCRFNITPIFASSNESESNTGVSHLNATTNAPVTIILTDYSKNIKIPGGSINRR